MKKLMKTGIMVTGLFLTLFSASYAAAPLSLDGNKYGIMAFCENDAGDYCSTGDIKNDTFTFEDNKFIVDSFNNGVLGVGDSGSYNENGLSFTASYEVITDNPLNKYAFDVNGTNFFDIFIFGDMNIAYYKLGFSGYDKEDESKAFFFGFKK